MTQSGATRTIIDTHRHIFGPKLRQKFVENIGFDDSKPLPQANAGEMFFYRESVDVDYSMEIQRQSGVSSCVNSYGGEVETFGPVRGKRPSISVEGDTAGLFVPQHGRFVLADRQNKIC
jgi:hypothetical protein